MRFFIRYNCCHDDDGVVVLLSRWGVVKAKPIPVIWIYNNGAGIVRLLEYLVARIIYGISFGTFVMNRTSSIVWRDIPDALSKYFHTVTVDLIGSDASEKPQNADYTIEVDSIIERIKTMDKEHTIFLYSSSVLFPLISILIGSSGKVIDNWISNNIIIICSALL